MNKVFRPALNNLESKLYSMVVAETREILEKLRTSSPQVLIHNKDNHSFIKKLNLREEVVREIDKEYIPQPERYMVMDTMLFMHFIKISPLDLEEFDDNTICPTLKYRGTYQGHAVYTELLLPQGTLMVIEDDNTDSSIEARTGMKLIGNFVIKPTY